MSDEVYSVPQAELELDDKALGTFYVVGAVKFWVLYIATMGLYQIYWFYKNWHNFKLATVTNMWPPMRGIFAIFFTHSLFHEVDQVVKDQEIDVQWSPGTLATWYVILAITSSVTDRLSDKSIGSPYTDIASVLVLPLIAIVLYKAQRVINVAMGDPDGISNSRFTAANIFWIALGSLMWLMVAVGLVVIMNPDLMPQ